MKRISFSLLLLVCSCNPYNRYTPPQVESPSFWKEEVALEGEVVTNHWWTMFDDEELTCLEEKALAANRDLQASWYNFRQSVWMSTVARSKLFPQITANPSYTRLNQYSNFPGLPVRFDQKSYTLPLEGQFDVDLWNQLGLNAQAAAFTAESEGYAFQTLRVNIAAEVAQNYFSIRTIDSEIEVLKQNIAFREEQVEVTRARFNAGLVDYTDVSRAETELSTIRADLEESIRLRVNFVNALAVLTGTIASYFDVFERDLASNLPAVPPLLPSDILYARPDILQAERIVAANHAEIGVAWASFLPSFTLQGTIGYSTPFYTQLFDWQSRLWGYAYQIAQTVFDGGGIWGTYQASKEGYLQSIALYESTVLKAFSEVESALANIDYRNKQELYLIESVRTARESLDLINLRYEKGVINYLDVVDAERTYLEVSREEVRSRGAQFIATVGLIKSLGGGWLNIDCD